MTRIGWHLPWRYCDPSAGRWCWSHAAGAATDHVVIVRCARTPRLFGELELRRAAFRSLAIALGVSAARGFFSPVTHSLAAWYRLRLATLALAGGGSHVRVLAGPQRTTG